MYTKFLTKDNMFTSLCYKYYFHLFCRFWLVARRCEKTLQHLPASVCEHLPFLHGPDHPLNKLSPDRLYVTLHRHTDHILVWAILILKNYIYFPRPSWRGLSSNWKCYGCLPFINSHNELFSNIIIDLWWTKNHFFMCWRSFIAIFLECVGPSSNDTNWH